MSSRLLVSIGVAALLLGACVTAPAPSPSARIVAFTASAERVPRGEPVTLTWQAADAGVQDGLFSCVLTRRFGDEPTATTLQATCAGSAPDVPPAPLTATDVHYRFEVLKQPYDEDDPYLASERTVALDAAKYAVRAGGADGDSANAVSTLPDGGAIVAGSFAGTATFGTITRTAAGSSDAFVARMRPDGTWAWATRAGSTGADGASGVSALPDGGALVVGTFSGTVNFGATPLVSAGSEDVFVARIRPDGGWAWATRAGGGGADRGLSVSTLADGGAVLVGYFAGSAAFGGSTLISAGDFDAFFARIHPDGTWAWASRAGSADPDYGWDVSTLADGSAIVTGQFRGTAVFGATTLTSSGSDDIFVAKANPDGTWAWATRAGGPSIDAARRVVAHADGSAIVAGSTYATATFGATTLTSVGQSDVFVARIHPDGTWAWATRGGGAGADVARAMSALADGGAIVAGSFGGVTSGAATFGATTFASAGLEDVFVARIRPDGTWAWANQAGSTGIDFAFGAGTLADGGAIVAGRFVGTATFGGTNLISAGSANDAFVARIGADGTW